MSFSGRSAAPNPKTIVQQQATEKQSKSETLS
jgi:hypothetical protein